MRAKDDLETQEATPLSDLAIADRGQHLLRHAWI